MKWKPWTVLTSMLVLSLMGLLTPLTAWAHQRVQRVIVPPPPSLSVSMEIQKPLVDHAYHVSVHNQVTGTSTLPNGDYLVSRMIISSYPPVNGDLPDAVSAMTGDPRVVYINTCRIGSTDPTTYTPQCPSSSAHSFVWNTMPISLFGGQSIQAKMSLFPHFPTETDAQTFSEQDWLQWRIGESQTIYLPTLQGTATPQSIATPTA